MRVTILGAGVIAGALARPWSAAGHEVTLGVRDPGRTGGIAGAAVRPLPEALESAEPAHVTVMAIPAGAVAAVCERYAPLLDHKIVVDPTVTFGPVMSQHEVLRRAGVRYVRAFSTQGPEVLAAPVVAGQAADQFFTADDDESRRAVAELITGIGLHPVHVGGSEHVHVVDGVTRLWFALAVKQGLGRHLGFRLLAG